MRFWTLEQTVVGNIVPSVSSEDGCLRKVSTAVLWICQGNLFAPRTQRRRVLLLKSPFSVVSSAPLADCRCWILVVVVVLDLGERHVFSWLYIPQVTPVTADHPGTRLNLKSEFDPFDVGRGEGRCSLNLYVAMCRGG